MTRLTRGIYFMLQVYLQVTIVIETYLISTIFTNLSYMSSFNTVADKCLPKGSGSSMGFSFPFGGMPQCIPFDEKNAKTWNFATEAALEVIGALDIVRVKEYVIPVPSRGMVKVEAIQENDFSNISS